MSDAPCPPLSPPLNPSVKTAQQVAHEWGVAAQFLAYRSQTKPVTAQDIQQASTMFSPSYVLARP